MAPRRLVQYPEVADNGGFEVAESRAEQQEDGDRARIPEIDALFPSTTMICQMAD
jgi:hypothetical protein